jgi:ferredoxin--NADP+ reductase
MHRVRVSEELAPRVHRLVVEAPRVARRPKPGQFVLVRLHERAERIPLTIAHADAKAGIITLIVQAVGASTEQLCALKAGDAISDVVGPLGKPTPLESWRHAVVVGGGVGTAVILPQARALHRTCGRVTAIVGGRSREYVLLERELAECCQVVLPCTDDGSYGYHGFVSGQLHELIEKAEPPVQAIYCAGPVPMMKAIAEVTRPAGIRTYASLNPVMVDGTGMCGGCRVRVGGEMRFACVDGPEFDAHQIDFDELTSRLATYRKQEQAALQVLHDHQCRLDAEVMFR